MQRHVLCPEETTPHIAWAAVELQRIAADHCLPPQVRAGAAELAVTLDGLFTQAQERCRAVERVLGEVTCEYDDHDVRWIERRQRTTGHPLRQVMEERFAKTAARALRKAAEKTPFSLDYMAAVRKVSAGEWHYLDLISYLRCAPKDLSMSEKRAHALERSEQRLRAMHRYWEDMARMD